MQWTITGEVFEWRGPAPFHFVETSDEAGAFLHDHIGALSYGWGCIPATVQVGETSESTALIPKDDVYLVPLKVKLRRREGIEPGDPVTLTLTVADP